MVRSLRLRLQIWYAVVLVAVVGTMAAALYVQVRHNRLRAIDARLEAAASFLEGTVRGLPPHEVVRHMRGPRPFRRGDGPGVPTDGPGFGDGPPPHHDPPHDLPHPPPPPDRPKIELPATAVGPPGETAEEAPYFVIWREDGRVLASSPGMQTAAKPALAERRGLGPPFRWQAEDRREMLLDGPRETTILVGKPAGRELAELRWFAGRLAASGLVVLVVGLAGGWLISRSITRPLAAISATASEISARNLARRIETTDIDQELVGLASVLNEMFARLEAAFDRQSRFTSDASHELRTPLAVIHSHAELALSKPRSAEEYRETLQACLKAASRMATIVDGLLMLARADAGRLDGQFRALDLRSVVEDVVDQYRGQAETAGIALSTSLDEPAPVRGDPALLARVSSNLLSNALRYTPSGGRVHVALSAVGSDGAVLAVEDSGCGIALEDQDKVFERFFRADKARSRAQGGNGLGLAICKMLVEAHRGSIAFRSAPDRGTRFEVRLPLAERIASGNEAS